MVSFIPLFRFAVSPLKGEKRIVQKDFTGNKENLSETLRLLCALCGKI